MTTPTRSTRGATQHEKDRALTASMVLSGVGHAEIAEKLGVSRQQITYDMRVIRERWKARTTMDLTEAKALEVAKIDRLEQVYWEAWELQCEDEVYADKEAGEGFFRVKHSGDPAILAGILKCIDRRCKLLGLDAPTQIEGRFFGFTIAFDTPSGPRSPEDLEALAPHTNGNGRVIDHGM